MRAGCERPEDSVMQNFVLPRVRRARIAAWVVLAVGGLLLGLVPAPARAATAPTAVDDHYEMTTGTVLTVSRPGLLTNDVAPQPDSLLWINTHTDPAQGTLAWNGQYANGDYWSGVDGRFSYEPPAGFVGVVTFTYSPRDYATNLQGGTATVSIDVKPVGQPVTLLPEVADDDYKYAYNTPLYIAAPGILGNDSLHGTVTSLSVDKLPSLPMNLTLNPDGSFLFSTVSSGATLWFDYKLCTPAGCGLGHVTIRQTLSGEQPSGPSTPPVGANAAPTAGKDSYAAVAGAKTVIPAPGLLANDTDPDGDPLVVKSVGTPQGATENGKVDAWSANGSVTYTPNVGFHGKDQLTYVLSDGSHDVAGAIEFTVTEPAGYAPTAVDDEASIRSGSVLRLPLGGVLANDTDYDGDPLTVIGHTGPAHGTATVAPTGAVTYTPAAGFVGPDHIGYTVSDGARTATGTLTIDVTAANAPLGPIALGNRYRTPPHVLAGDQLTVPAPGLLGNDHSRSGSPLKVTTKTANDHGSVVIQPDGSFTYLPFTGFSGTARFDYTVSDGISTSTGHVAILVGGQPVPPDPAPAAFDAAPAPVVTGVAQFGGTLTATPGSWAPQPDSTTYQWLRDGKVILGETGTTYRPRAADVDASISIRVTGEAWGLASTQRVSAALTIAPAHFAGAPAPRATGVAKKGRRLMAVLGSWAPGPEGTTTYQWLRNGKVIRGATGATYRLKAKDRGRRISVRVTVSRPGYASVVATSPARRPR